MQDFLNSDTSEFEREFEFEDEAITASDEFELGDEELGENGDSYELEDALGNDEEYGDGFGPETEADYLSEFEADGEPAFGSEQEFENTTEGNFERRLYEIFSHSYENEYEFENDFNQVMHEVQRDYFWNSLKRWGRKLAPVAKLALRAIPGGGTLTNAIRQITRDPRGLLKTLVMKFGPQALNAVIPGAGVALGALMSNRETDDAARQAARDTVALAREAYTNFADEISRTNFPTNIAGAKAQLNDIARNSFKKAQRTVRLGSSRHRYRKVNRKVEDMKNGMYKIVTITYKRV
ncbi:hypothetical protein [Pontibacter chitinilyticus]|uniref:hypothetical protein n=1 Tax=Pontibacter chitinilyticus TaxID=2674989 RepID=UPI00321AFC9D